MIAQKRDFMVQFIGVDVISGFIDALPNSFAWGRCGPIYNYRPKTPPPAQCMLGYGQQAGGTHPTGMQSCFPLCLRNPGPATVRELELTNLKQHIYSTRMHSSRMCTARSLTVSRCILCMAPRNHACPPQPCTPPATMHVPLATTHAPQATTHAPLQPHMSPQPCTPPATMHAPWQPCMRPSNHAHPHPCEQNDKQV